MFLQKYVEPISFFTSFSEMLNEVQIRTVRRQIDKFDSNCFCVFLNEFATLILGIVQEQIDREPTILVNKFVKQFNKRL